MDKFKKFIGKVFKFDALKNSDFLNNLSIRCQYLPEQIEEFDEVIFLLDNIAICVAILEGKVKRIMLVKVDENNPDECSPLTKEELESFLRNNEDKLLKFFENTTE